MKRSRVGLVIEDEHVAVAAIRKGGQPVYFRLRADEELPGRLTAQLRARRLGTRAIRIGLDRSRVVVKAIDVPRTAEENRRSLVAFELERHLPFAGEDTRFDWTPLPGGTDGLGRVLVAATDGPTVDGALRLVESAQTRPRSVTVACHALPILLERGRLPSRAVWIHGRGARTIILFLERRQVRLSRSVPRGTGPELAAEIQRSLPLAGWTQCEKVWVSGDETPDFRASFRRGCLSVAIAAPPLGKTATRLMKRLPPEERGSALLALAVAAGRRQPPLDLVPGALRARVLSWVQTFTAGMAVAAGGLGLALLLAHGHAQSTHLARLNTEIRRLDPEVKAVEQLGADVKLHRQLLSVLHSVQSGGLQPLPVLKDLTELVPTDAWVQSVSMGREGLEVTGQATTASALISLLEGSPWLERVEFTSPVTRAQGKEQFRLHADWENPARSSADAEPSRPARKGR